MDSSPFRRDPVVCRCGTTCVGAECYMRRSTELVARGRLHDARNLLEDALQQNETETLREQLQTIYQVIASTARQPRLENPTPVLTRPTSSSNFSANDDVTMSRAGTQRDCSLSDQFCDRDRRVDANPVLSSSSASANVIPNAAIRDNILDTLTCVICYNLLYDPVTTPCGHTFCNACLTRAIDFTSACPTCRGVLHMGNATGLPVANTLRDAILSIFPDLYESRRIEVAAEGMKSVHGIGLLPIFPLSAVAFPMESFPMHIFEACYRLMLRRIMRGNRRFGLVNVKQRSDGSSYELCKVGCVLEVTKVISLPDGRSLIETIGRERFLLGDVTDIDGYRVTRAEPYSDNENSDEVELRDLENRARKIMNSHMERVGESSQIQRVIQRAGQFPIPSQGHEALGLWLANVLFTEERDRQRLLEMRNSATRLREMVSIMESRLTNSECRLQ